MKKQSYTLSTTKPAAIATAISFCDRPSKFDKSRNITRERDAPSAMVAITPSANRSDSPNTGVNNAEPSWTSDKATAAANKTGLFTELFFRRTAKRTEAPTHTIRARGTNSDVPKRLCPRAAPIEPSRIPMPSAGRTMAKTSAVAKPTGNLLLLARPASGICSIVLSHYPFRIAAYNRIGIAALSSFYHEHISARSCSKSAPQSW